MLTRQFFYDIVCIAKRQYGSFYVSERGMHMSDRFVNLVGRIPKEDYEKILSGELTFNKGLRNAKGPASFYSKQPEMWIQLPEGVLSTKYNIYVITFPPRYEEQLAEEEEGEKTNGLSFTLYYSKTNGTIATEEFKNGNDEEQAEGEKTYYYPAADQIDIISVGQFTFPVCYAGTDYSPCLRIGQKRLSTNAKRKEFSRHLRIAAVLLVPTE